MDCNKTMPLRRATQYPEDERNQPAEKRKNELYVQEETQQKGLCSACRNAPTCTFPRDSNRPILQCEEFEGDTASQKTLSITGASIRWQEEEREGRNRANEVEYKGLCRNCELRDTCTYPKPDCGVWFCEEYE